MIEAAARAIQDGELVVYPTETVYGLGGDATDPAVVERVFETKGRSRDHPISLAVPSLEAAADYVAISDVERSFARTFLPGPVTVVCERQGTVPDVLTAGRDRVGLRVPDCQPAREFLRAAGTAITATSANRSGSANARRPEQVDEVVRDAAAVVVDGGETPGGESTVVDVSAGTIHRPGREADAIRDWLATNL